ncbi:hypothetical protein MXAN_6942 [Myxococcus xanthus DK 1622]|uniref:Uncharacterized protein n=1 Tax=Myxococcus xanthus (strain DK1622) TaxID=246197 RepID=Q1CX16_MYXXD|nr:hypothetical protein MXAN_6942 [Myxococcus xanthus DK 1622]
MTDRRNPGRAQRAQLPQTPPLSLAGLPPASRLGTPRSQRRDGGLRRGGAPGVGRRGVLITEASQNRDEAEPGDERFFSSGLEAHELGATTPAVTTEP